jgi:hypothetical protein
LALPVPEIVHDRAAGDRAEGDVRLLGEVDCAVGLGQPGLERGEGRRAGGAVVAAAAARAAQAAMIRSLRRRGRGLVDLMDLMSCTAHLPQAGLTDFYQTLN